MGRRDFVVFRAPYSSSLSIFFGIWHLPVSFFFVGERRGGEELLSFFIAVSSFVYGSIISLQQTKNSYIPCLFLIPSCCLVVVVVNRT